MRLTPLLLLVPLVLGLAPAHASSTGDCYNPDGTPSLGIVEVGTGDARDTFYVDARSEAPGFGNSWWIYQESNGDYVGGDAARDLQRGAPSAFNPVYDATPIGGYSDPCVDDDGSGLGPDTLLY